MDVWTGWAAMGEREGGGGNHETSPSPIPLCFLHSSFSLSLPVTQRVPAPLFWPLKPNTQVFFLLTHGPGSFFSFNLVFHFFFFLSGTRQFVKIMSLPFAMMFRFFPLNFKYLENRQRGGNWQTRSKLHNTQPRQLRRS